MGYSNLFIVDALGTRIMYTYHNKVLNELDFGNGT
jgi:hypothetical protein